MHREALEMQDVRPFIQGAHHMCATGTAVSGGLTSICNTSKSRVHNHVVVHLSLKFVTAKRGPLKDVKICGLIQG